MIQHTFSADGFERTDKLQKYVTQKVKTVEKYIPRRMRDGAKLSVRITKTKSKAEMYNCRLELQLPKKTLISSEKVEHSYAALDVTIAELKRQLADHKSKSDQPTLRRRATQLFRRRDNRFKKTDSEE